MEVLNILEHYWAVFSGFAVIIAGAFKFFYDMRAMQARVKILEDSLEANYQNDTDAKETVTKKLTRMDRKFDYFSTIIQMMAEKMQLKIPVMPKFDEE